MESDFSRFALLPDEILEMQCEQMDFDTLVKFGEAYDRVYHVCKRVYDRKEKEHQRLTQVSQTFTKDQMSMQDLCQYMDDQSLINFANANAKVAKACSTILRQRGLI